MFNIQVQLNSTYLKREPQTSNHTPYHSCFDFLLHLFVFTWCPGFNFAFLNAFYEKKYTLSSKFISGIIKLQYWRNVYHIFNTAVKMTKKQLTEMKNSTNYKKCQK